MQPLDIISVNIWSIIISLANLVILFFILKFFLFKPAKKILSQRQSSIDKIYNDAELAKSNAEENKAKWNEKIKQADTEADKIIEKAENDAEIRKNVIINDANKKAEGIIKNAEASAELELKKAKDTIKKDVTELSCILAEKMLEREVSAEDHRNLIDSFISEVGDTDGSDS